MSQFKRAHDDNQDAANKKSRGEYTPEQVNRFVNTIRILSADMVEKANSGHPGAPMGCAPIAHVLFSQFMNYSPKNPKFFNRDRFVLSNGHSCALLYSMLHLTGYDLSIEDLQQFRQLGSMTPGHPENFVTPGVEVSTGPLGQGISNAVGLAIAEKHLGAVYNKAGKFDNIVNHYTYVLCGDGCLQEGVSSEASSLAGHLGLGKLIVCYDDNKITIDGDTSLSFTEDVGKRYEAYNWQVLTVEDGNDLQSLTAAIEQAKTEVNKPTLIKVRTVIGYGSGKAGSHGVHGAPLGKSDLAHVKQSFGFDPNQSFHVDESTYQFYREQVNRGADVEAEWQQNFTQYQQEYPELAQDLSRRMNNQLPENLVAKLPSYDAASEKKAAATRNRSEEVLNALGAHLPELMGGSADLTPSNLTFLKCSGDFQHATPAGRYIRFGVREHAMAAICNGMWAHGGLRPYCATFLNFIGYALGAVRLSALSRFPVIYVMTHDSIGLGEDGPTHQPVEILNYLRCTPNLLTIRPADGNETSGAYNVALTYNTHNTGVNTTTPVVISLSRQACPTLAHSCAGMVSKGAYTLQTIGSGDQLQLVLVATGTEVHLAEQVAQQLISTNSLMSVRVVSMPCAELFDQQSLEYKHSVFPANVPVMSIEASSTAGWRNKYAHAAFGIPEDCYGISAPADRIYQHFGFSVDNLATQGRKVVDFYAGKNVPDLFSFPDIIATPTPLH